MSLQYIHHDICARLYCSLSNIICLYSFKVPLISYSDMSCLEQTSPGHISFLLGVSLYCLWMKINISEAVGRLEWKSK